MIDDKNLPKQKIRTFIVWFAAYMSLMLFQTPYMYLGTITAFLTLAMTVFWVLVIMFQIGKYAEKLKSILVRFIISL